MSQVTQGKAKYFLLFSFLLLDHLLTLPFSGTFYRSVYKQPSMLKGQKSLSEITLPMENTNTFKRNIETPMKTAFKKPHEDEEDNDEEDVKQYSIRFLILDYFEYTSGHGPPRILASKQLIRKIFWTLLFLAALGVSSWQINTLFNTYKARPLSTHVAIKHETVGKPFVPLMYDLLFLLCCCICRNDRPREVNLV